MSSCFDGDAGEGRCYKLALCTIDLKNINLLYINSSSQLSCPGNVPIPPVLRHAIHGAQDTSAVRARRRPLRGLEKMPTQRLNKRKSTRFHGCFFFFLTGNYLSSQAASSQVLSAYVGLTAVFEMGTGGTPQLSSPDYLTEFAFACSLKTPHRKKIRFIEK